MPQRWGRVMTNRLTRKRKLLGCALAKVLLLPMLCLCGTVNAVCPDLTPFYSAGNNDWENTRMRLGEMFEDCLLSSEYFALYGAALLNTGSLDAAIESLERALLLEPENGAAMIDYAQALLQDGQIFAAIEANGLVLEREDVPANLALQVAERQRQWLSLTRQTSWQVDVLGGYDNNLNGAPDQDLITLTLSGESVFLGLSPEFQVISGPYMNLRVLGRHRRITPENQHNFFAEFRGRLSEDSNSDLSQISTRYSLLRPDNGNSWQLNTGINNLFFAGKPLFTGSDASFRYQFANSNLCRPYYTGAVQHQLWHEQSQLNGLEAKIGVGNSCSLFGSSNQRLNSEFSVLHNAELKPDRLGGSREGWQFVLEWQAALSRGLLVAQYNHTRVRDREGYSPLLANDARRDVERHAFLVQYRENLPQLSPNAVLLVNLYHQDQASNLELFQTKGTAFEVGISWRF